MLSAVGVFVLSVSIRNVLGLNVLSYVDPYIGTSYPDISVISNKGDYGNTVPQVGVPNAHSPWSPQTVATEQKCYSPYYYMDPNFHGIRKTHFMSGSCVIEYGSMTVIPATTLDINEALQFHTLDHARETVSPAHYKIELVESGVTVEAANDNRAGILKFNLENFKSNKFYLIIMGFDLEYNQSSVTITSENTVEFSNPAHRWYQASGQAAGFSGHHFLQFSHNATSFGTIRGYTKVHAGDTEGVSDASGIIAAYLEFDAAAYSDSPLGVAVGSSFVSREKARRNMLSELSAGSYDASSLSLFDLDGLIERVSRAWETALSTVDIHESPQRVDYNGSDVSERLRMFYTALWHSMLLPRQHSDYDGEYLSFDGSNSLMAAKGFVYMDDFSTWDVYRATIPLQYLLFPEGAKDLVLSLIAKTEQGGWLPIFPAWNSYTDEMIGDHCAVLIADAYLKGILNASDESARKAYDIVRRNAVEIPPLGEFLRGKGRRGIQTYLQYGFVPLENPIPFAAHDGEQASRTLEFAYDDFVVSQFAALMGYDDDRDMFLARSENYRNVIDSEGVGYVRGRHADLTWFGEDEAFDPAENYSWLTEATAWQYSWYVPHNVEALIGLYKGDEAFAQKLNTFFDGGYYNHGNEPDHQAAFMYAYTSGTKDGAWRVQQRVRSILSEQYRSDPGGLPGNEDAGQMSSWYVLASLGLYPVCPGCGGHSEYVLSSPLFDSGRIRVGADGDKYFLIQAAKLTKEDIYIQRALLNGNEYDCAFIAHRDIISGGELHLEMGPEPNVSWATKGRTCLLTE